jgi:hypothetical protein
MGGAVRSAIRSIDSALAALAMLGSHNGTNGTLHASTIVGAEIRQALAAIHFALAANENRVVTNEKTLVTTLGI